MPGTSMVSGTVIACRFLIQGVAGRGGVSTVYRAIDQRQGRPVALKLLHRSSQASQSGARMVLEAQLLAELRHPGIVGYIAHGHTETGLPFLAMEWLDGEDLASRLLARPLTLRETVVLFRAAAEALAAAHRHGIIHRDIKPSNLFLRDGKVECVTLLDFGVARRAERTTGMTQAGVILGTPEFMAPEQARGQSQLTAAADVFSLGCVLFRCLTGVQPFRASHLSALLAKLLFDDAPSIRQRRSDIPDSLARLIDWMLMKAPQDRPQDGTALLEALSGLPGLTCADPTPDSMPAADSLHLFRQEQHLVSVVMASQAGAQLIDDRTLEPAELPEAERSARQLLAAQLQQLGGYVEFLVDESVIVVLTSEQTAVDLVLKASRCALLIQERWPTALVAVATGCAHIRERRPIGEAIDRVGEFINLQSVAPPASDRPQRRRVMLDEVSAGLLRAHYSCVPLRPGLFVLEHGNPKPDQIQPLLGKVTAFIGRQRELALIEAALDESFRESNSRAVLLTAESGMGKTRLRHELLRRLPGSHPEAVVLMGLASGSDSSRPGSLLGQALRRLGGSDDLSAGPLPAIQRIERLGHHLTVQQRQQIAPLLSRIGSQSPADRPGSGWLPTSADGSLSDSEVQAVLQFLRAECADHPLLIILEDLQWSDAATVRLIGRALRELAGQPLFVLGIARPEVRKRFPRLWNEHRFLELHLDRLNEASSATLAREVLGQEVPMATIRRITDQAGSNPQHLEELIRWVDEGRENEPPGTLIAMLQAHLLTLPVEERRLLRAASIFGQSFSLPGLLFLLAADATPQEVERWLRSLVEQEIIVRDRRYTPEQQSAFRFRSTLMQEAAYSLLSPADRSAGHRLARTFLAAAGEDSCWLLATHAERGGELSRAGVLYCEAAEQLAQEDNFTRALEACRSALRCATGADERQAALAVELHVQSLRALTSSLPKP